MKIEVTGCNNCPFRFRDLYGDGMCVFYFDIKEQSIIDNVDSVNSFIKQIPHNCPITLNGGTITVTTKSEYNGK